MKVCIDPDAGGATIVSGGHPPTILAAGYVGSTILGGLFIMAGFGEYLAPEFGRHQNSSTTGGQRLTHIGSTTMEWPHCGTCVEFGCP